MGRPKGSKNKPKEMKRSKLSEQKFKDINIEPILEEDRLKLQNIMDRIPLISDDGYRIKETIAILKIFGFSSKKIKQFLIDGTIPLK